MIDSCSILLAHFAIAVALFAFLYWAIDLIERI